MPLPYIASMLSDNTQQGNFADAVIKHSKDLLRRTTNHAPEDIGHSLFYPTDPNGKANIKQALAGVWLVPILGNIGYLFLPAIIIPIILAFFFSALCTLPFILVFIVGHFAMMILMGHTLRSIENKVRARVLPMLPARPYAPYPPNPTLKSYTALIQNSINPTSHYRQEPLDIGVFVLDPKRKCLIVDGLCFRQIICKTGFVGATPGEQSANSAEITITYLVGNTRLEMKFILTDIVEDVADIEERETEGPKRTQLLCDNINQLLK